MKKIVLLALTATLVSCGVHQKNPENADPMKYANTITSQELKDHLYTFADDEFEGRNTGEPGQKKAAEYIRNEFIQLNIPSPQGVNNYYQVIPTEYFNNKLKASENVLGYIEGRDRKSVV